MKLYTIGYSGKTAEDFFELLKKNKIECLVDIRIYPNHDGVLYASKRDLPYLLREIADCAYEHNVSLAPTSDLLDKIHEDNDWVYYEQEFSRLLAEREIPQSLDRNLFWQNTCCLLCFEETADYCHRRLVAEHIQRSWEQVEIIHL